MEAVFSPFIIFMLSFMSLPNDDVVDIQNIANKCLFNINFELNDLLGYLSYVILPLPFLHIYKVLSNAYYAPHVNGWSVYSGWTVQRQFSLIAALGPQTYTNSD